jgi:hypothetical protein
MMTADRFYRIRKSVDELSAVARRLIRLGLTEEAKTILDVADSLIIKMEEEVKSDDNKSVRTK